MGNIFRKLFILGLPLAIFLFVVSPSFASTFYLSPRSVNIPSGSTRSVTIGINTQGESINGVSAYLTYPADKLDVVDVRGGAAFGIDAERSFGGGSIKVSRGSISGFTGQGTIATIIFRGKAQGPATVSFVAGSAAARTSNSTDSLNLGASTGGVFTVTAPAAGGPAVEEKLAIKNVVVSAVSTNSATITWQTDERSDSTVEYGLAKDNYILAEYNRTLVTNHSIKLEGKALTPGAEMHFIVRSKNSAGDEGVSEDYTFKLKGYNIRIVVQDTNKMPIPNAEVIFYPNAVKVKTDAEGQVQFQDVTPGIHVVAVKLPNGFDKIQDVDVKESNSLQTFFLGIDTSVASKASGGDLIRIMLAGAIVALTIIVGIVMLIIKRRRDSKKNNPPNIPNITQNDITHTPPVPPTI